MQNRHGFTIVELLIVIIVIAVLASISIVSYNGFQERAARSTVRTDVLAAAKKLETYYAFNESFPPNLSGTGFSGSDGVALSIYTNAPTVGVYNSLTDAQEAQLLLNVCNGNLAGTNNTSCTFSGNGNGAKIHVAGTGGSNTHWGSSGTIADGDILLTCGGSPCTSAVNAIKSQFIAQGGSFPVSVTGSNVALPEPTVTPNGEATRYCLEARYGNYPDVVVSISSENGELLESSCPDDPDLSYYPTS